MVRATYLVSVLVCCLCEYETFPLSFRSKAAVIEPLCRIPRTILVRASDTLRAPSAILIVSSPQQLLACRRILPVDWASLPPK